MLYNTVFLCFNNYINRESIMRTANMPINSVDISSHSEHVNTPKSPSGRRKLGVAIVSVALALSACSADNGEGQEFGAEETTITSVAETTSIESIADLTALSSEELIKLPTDTEIPAGTLYVEKNSPSSLTQAQEIINDWVISMGVYENLGNGSTSGAAELYLSPNSVDWGGFISYQQASSNEVTTYRRKNSAQSKFWTTSVVSISSFEKVAENEFTAEGVEVITNTFDPDDVVTVSDEFRFVRHSFEVDGVTHLAWVLAPPK